MNHETKNINIWQQAVKMSTKQQSSLSFQKTLIVVGNPSSGKTNLIRTLKGSQIIDQTKNSFLEYNFVRKAGIRKQVISCYEIGSIQDITLLSSLITKEKLPGLVIVICIDLNHPGSAMENVTEWLTAVRNQFVQIDKFTIHQVAIFEDVQKYAQKVRDDISHHQDSQHISCPPCKTVIVGCKYDHYEKYDLQNRKWLTKAFRFQAHVNYCTLCYFSIKYPELVFNLKNLLLQAVFSQRRRSTMKKQIDHTKPIFVSSGEDSLVSISISTSGSLKPIDVLKKQIQSLFGFEEVPKKREPIDLSKYYELRIDNLIINKKKQGQQIKKGIRNLQFYNKKL